ncbi:hypothetical protein JXA80_01680, partial [bacterium]|nr:hypothetical protein [candidate division CSSED10-310 bacterium]
GEGPHREKAREMMLSLKIWKVTEELAVDDALATRLYPAIRELEDVRFELRQSMERDAIVLRDALGVEPLDSDAVTRAVQTTKEHRRGYMRREFEKIDTILAMLTVEQQARFLLLEMEFEDDVRQFLRERRERRRGPSPAPAEFPQ